MNRRTEVLADQPGADPYPRSASAMSHNRSISEASVGSSAGRPLAQQPDTYSVHSSLSPTAKIASRFGSVSASGMYRESGQRWMERQEARSLRDALEEMDLQDENRLHSAAQDEATRLVWEHRNPGVPYKNPNAAYRNPDLQGSNRFRQHLEKGSHARSQSMGGYGDPSPDPRGYRSSSESSGSPPSPDSYNETSATNGHRKKTKVNFALPPQELSAGSRGTGSRSRTVSGDSSKGVFRNPEDYIYEETEEGNYEANTQSTAPAPSALRVKPRNSLPQGARPLPHHSSTFPQNQKLSKVDIHKNPPSQSRNPLYTANPSIPPSSGAMEDDVPKKNGIEIRGDDIRAATGMKFKDRSAKLPMPSAVSDRPGHPIVSFDPSWKPQEEQHSSPLVPTINVTETPNVPTINLPGDQTPSISVSSAEGPNDQTPKISVSTSDEANNGTRPLPEPSKNRFSKATDPKRMTPTSQSKWYSPFSRTGVPTATCTHCTLPISGRIVTAAGSRFHPECFTCHHCGTGLECVAFYQEPDAKRDERLASAANGDEEAECLRFYCHLDFHELFSPRCKSCKTPIEGEVIVACGAEWHVGHFFCAECGDVSSLLPHESSILMHSNSHSTKKRPLWKRMDLHGVSAAILVVQHLVVWAASNPSSMRLSLPLSEARGMTDAFAVMNAAVDLVPRDDSSSKKVNPNAQPRDESSADRYSWLSANDASLSD